MVAGEVAIPRLASPGLHTSFTLNSRFAHARNRRIVLRYRGNHKKTQTIREVGARSHGSSARRARIAGLPTHRAQSQQPGAVF
jgi:hypothetical protein